MGTGITYTHALQWFLRLFFFWGGGIVEPKVPHWGSASLKTQRRETNQSCRQLASPARCVGVSWHCRSLNRLLLSQANMEPESSCARFEADVRESRSWMRATILLVRPDITHKRAAVCCHLQEAALGVVGRPVPSSGREKKNLSFCPTGVQTQPKPK